MADSTVKIGADISEIRRELAKLPNLSTEAAQKTLIQIEKAVQKAEKSAKRSAKAIRASQRKTTKALDSEIKKLGDKAGDTDSILKALGGAIGLISPEAERALIGIGDLSGGVEAVTKSSTHLGLTLKAVWSVAAPFTVALAALGTAALVVANRADEASEGLDRYKKVISDTDAETRSLVSSQSALKLATGDVAGFIGDLEIQTALLNGEIEDADLKAGALGGTLADKLAPSLLAAGKAVAENEARIRDLRDSLASGSLGMDDLAKANKELTEALTTQPELEENLRAIKALGADGSDAINEFVKALRKKDEAEKKGKKSTADFTEALEKEASALEAFLDIAGELVGATAENERARRALNDEIEDSPPDLIPAQWVKDIRELSDQVDALVPPAALDEITQLEMLLASVTGAAKGATQGNAELQEMIDRLTKRIAKLNAEQGETAENLDPDEPRTFWEVFTAGATAATAAAAGVAGAVSGSIDMFDRFLQLAGGFSLSDLAAVAAEGGDVGAIVEEMVKAGTETVRVFVESLPLVIDAFLAGLPSIISEFIKAIDPVVKAIGAAVPEVLGFVVAALPGLADTVADLLTSGLFDQVIAALPSVIQALLDLAPDLITAALAAVGDVVSALIAEIPGITLAIIEALPAILQAVSEGLIDLGDEVAEALIMELVLKSPELIAALVEALVIDLPAALAEGFIENIRGFFADLLTELKPGSQTTASFGDTPGAVVAPMAGLTARFAPGDTVIAAQDPQEALRQAQQAAGVSSSPQTVTLDLRDGHIAFDRMFRTNIRAGGSLSTLNTSPTGRVKVYG
jgi:hypothetical protein